MKRENILAPSFVLLLMITGTTVFAQDNTVLPEISPMPSQPPAQFQQPPPQIQQTPPQIPQTQQIPQSSPFNFRQFNNSQGLPAPGNSNQPIFFPQPGTTPQVEPISDNISDPYIRGKLLIRQATQLISSGQLDPAIALLQKSMEFRRVDPTPQFLLGLIYDQKGSLQAALSNYTMSVKKATALGMDSSQLRINLGNTLFKLNYLKEAEFDYKRAIEIDDKNEIAHLNYGRLLLFKADYAGAFKELQRAHELMVTDPNLPLYEALALKGLGNVEGSRQQLEVFLDRAKGINSDPKVINMAEKLLASMK